MRPELPREFVDTTYQEPGLRVQVPAGANLQAAINAAPLGSTLVLQAGATYGAVSLPAKSGAGWIYLISNGALPAAGQRALPAHASQMARIQVASAAAITTAAGAHHYRFVGIEIAVTGTLQQAAVNLDSGGGQPTDITFDRCYVHGTPSGTQRRGLQLHGARLAVIDSYVADFKESGADSQAIVAWDGTGPLKVVNTYLAGAGENLMIGGASPRNKSTVPSDIEIRGNHFYKPLAWRSASWSVKNLLEFKQGRRVLVEGNVFENNWAGGQVGFALLVTPRSEDGGALGATQDITVRLNQFVNIAQGVNLSGDDDTGPSERTNRILVEHNLMLLGSGLGGDGRAFQTIHGPSNVVINHNTVPNAGTSLMAENTPKASAFEFTNNIVGGGGNGIIGTGSGTGTPTLVKYFEVPYVVTANVIVPGIGTYPAGNFMAPNLGAVGFVDVAGKNYALSASSPYKGKATDGKDVGADIAAVNAAIAGAVTGQGSGGTPPPQPMPVNCVVGPFGDWTPWVETSPGIETHSRTRAIVTAPTNGGAACPALTETESRPIEPPPPPPPPVETLPLANYTIASGAFSDPRPLQAGKGVERKGQGAYTIGLQAGETAHELRVVGATVEVWVGGVKVKASSFGASAIARVDLTTVNSQSAIRFRRISSSGASTTLHTVTGITGPVTVIGSGSLTLTVK